MQLTASPRRGFLFSGWSGDSAEKMNPLSVGIARNEAIVANFTAYELAEARDLSPAVGRGAQQAFMATFSDPAIGGI